MKGGHLLHLLCNYVNIINQSIFVALRLLAKTCSVESDSRQCACKALGHHSGGSKTLWERHAQGFDFRV